MCAASSASAVKAFAPSPVSRSRFVQKSVMRVRGSFGLKFPAEFNEKGSARIETDSRATARVEVADTLNTSGLFWGAPNALARAPDIRAVNTAEAKLPKCRRKAARSLSGFSGFKTTLMRIIGAPSRTRTCGLLIRSQTLYPTELWVHIDKC